MLIIKNNRGDTIVEVLIALAIIGAVIGTTYAIASVSLRQGRQAQERTEALKVAESQIELLKEFGKTKTNLSVMYNINYRKATPSFVNSFCLTSSVTGIATHDQPTVPDDIFTVADPIATPYTPLCKQGQGGRYNVSVQRIDEKQFSGELTEYSTFDVRIRWDRLGGGRDEVKVLYKLHQGQL
jgi:type II secretory pathway pseudopilin PulG